MAASNLGQNEKIIYWYLMLLYIINLSMGQVSEQNFQTPPSFARPSTYWMWMNGNITKEGLTEDLEYMKRTGYGQALMFNTGVGIARGSVLRYT